MGGKFFVELMDFALLLVEFAKQVNESDVKYIDHSQLTPLLRLSRRTIFSIQNVYEYTEHFLSDSYKNFLPSFCVSRPSFRFSTKSTNFLKFRIYRI